MAVEFSLVGSVFCLLMLATIDVGRYQITMQSLHDISAEAARVVLVDIAASASSGCAAVPAQATLQSSVTSPNLAPMLDANSVVITPSCALASNGVRTVTVTSTYPFTFISPVLPSGALTLSDRTAISF